MRKLRGFFGPNTPPGTITSISTSAHSRKKIYRLVKGQRDLVIFTRPCLSHENDVSSLPVGLISPSQQIRHEPPEEWGQVCVLCWKVVERYPFQHKPKYFGLAVHNVRSGMTSAISLGNGFRTIRPTKHDSENAARSLYVNECPSHPPVRVPVSLFRFTSIAGNLQGVWASDEEVTACPICWNYTSIKKVSREILPVVRLSS